MIAKTMDRVIGNNVIRRFHSRAGALLSNFDTSKGFRVGVDLGSFSSKFAIVEINNGKGIIRDSWSRERGARSENEVIAECIQTLCKKLMHIAGKWSFKDVPVYLAISDKKVLVKRMWLPPMPLKEMRNALALKMEKEIESISEGVVIGFRINRERVEEEEKKYEITLAAAGSDFLEEKIRPFEGAGFTDVRPISSSMLYGDMVDSKTPCLLVDIGLTKTGLYCTSDGMSRLFREVGIGGINFTQALTGRFSYSKGVLELNEEVAEKMKRKYGLSQEKIKEGKDTNEATSYIPAILRPIADKLSDEIRRTLEFASSSLQLNPRKLVLAGGGSSIPGLSTFLEERLGLQVKFAEFNDFKWEVSIASTDSIRFHEMAMAVEVPLWKGKNEFLIPSGYKWRRKVNFERRVFKYASLLLAAFIISFSIISRDIVAESKGNVILVDSGKLMTMRMGDDAQRLDQERKQLNRWKEALSFHLPAGPDLATLLRELSHVIPSYILLTRLEVTPERSETQDETAMATEEMFQDDRVPENGNRFVVLMDGRVVAEPLFLEAYLSKFNLILNRCGLFDNTKMVTWERSENEESDNLSFSISCRIGEWAGE